jgi:uncharacterized delta-60 repeat protein
VIDQEGWLWERLCTIFVPVVATFVLIVGIATPAVAAPGDLDPSFGGDGQVTTDFGKRATGLDIAVQPDGRIIVAGKSKAPGSDDTDFAAVRYLPNGELDPDFGRDGRVRTDFGRNDHAIAIVLQLDGKIILAGTSGAGRNTAGQKTDYALVRYTPQGKLDPSFGTHGKVVTSFEATDFLQGVTLESDGKILASGLSIDAQDSDVHTVIARYNADGTLDLAFGTHGATSFDTSSLGALSVQADGKILTAGYHYGFEQDFYFDLFRFNADGTPDTSFGSGGAMTSKAPPFGFEGTVSFEPDGSILAAGVAETPAPNCFCPAFAVAKFLADGTSDRTFGDDGVVATVIGDPIGSYAMDVALQPDGKVIAAGFTFTRPMAEKEMFALVRYNPDGSRDQTFGRHGRVTTRFDQLHAGAAAVAIDAKGRALLAGGIGRRVGRLFRGFALARYRF